MVTVGWLAAGVAWGGSLRTTVEIGPEGPRVLRAWPTAVPARPVAPGALEIVDADGVVLTSASVPDPRRRSLILPEGGGVAVELERAVVAVDLPWPDGAVAVRTRLGTIRPGGAPRNGIVAVPVLASGPPSHRLDLVILGDGYTVEELRDFAEDTRWIVDHLLDVPPWGAYADLFNVWRIDVASVDSGVDQPGRNEARDTAFGCEYDCAGVERLVCCDDDAVLDLVDQVLPGADGILVLLNETEYGGSGGFAYATSHVGPTSGREVAAHELSHTLLTLWDEYDYGITGPGSGPNCAERPTGHWDAWYGDQDVGSFPACTYTNLFRPTDEGCLMRTLDEGFCPVCRERAVLEMYRRVPSIVRSVDPPEGERVGASTVFSVETTIPRHRLAFEWSVDGEVVREDDPELDVACTGWQGELTLRVHDPTPWVRADPDGLLEQTLGPWSVSTEPCAQPSGCGCGSRPRGWGSSIARWMARR